MESPSVIAALQNKKFILQHMLGEGSYAKVCHVLDFNCIYRTTEVYRAVYFIDENHTAELACKVIDTSTAPRIYLSKFLPRELDILARVNHPHIIHVTNIYQRYSKYFVFMRLGENGDLLNFISTKGPLSENQARIWMRQLICGLEYMHALNIAHRDLKCENILISRNFNVKLTDFGFARRTREGGTDDVMSDTFCGSLLYAAPEILKGEPYAPKMADIWSMAIIFYTMLNKAMPFNDSSVRKLYDKQIQRRWRFRTKIVSSLSIECLSLVTAMMDPDAQARPTATAVFHGPWIAMEPRLTKYTPLEESLLKQASKATDKPRNLEDFDTEAGDMKDTIKTIKRLDPNLLSTRNTSGPLAPGH